MHICKNIARFSKFLIPLLLQGCLSVFHYQPLSGLQRAYLVSYQEQNFKGLILSIRCQESPTIELSDVEALCEKMATLFESQGAIIKDRNTNETKSADLNLNFSSKKIYDMNNHWMWPVSILTMSLVPVEQEYAIEQTMNITDNAGQQLSAITLQARFVWVWGVGYWAANKVLNWTARSDAEVVSEEALSKDFSQDFYSQVSQTLFDVASTEGLKKQVQR